MTLLAPVHAVTDLARLALAHPGHGSTDGSSIAHVLTEPEHVVMVSVAVLVAVVLWRLKRARAGERSR